MSKKEQSKHKHHYVAIMAGGIGSRFWPLSRLKKPKQFLDILNNGESLLQSTFDRFAEFIPVENIFVITFEDYASEVAANLPQLPVGNILTEPSRKSTAPCVAYMAFKLKIKDPGATFIVAPADHLVLDGKEYYKVLHKALQFAEQKDALVTLGINPTYPNTGYGYIQHEEKEVEPGIYKVKTFTEKPNLEMAKTFLASGDFLWNSGVFIWRPDIILEALENYLPEMFEIFSSEKDHFETEQEGEALERIYPQCTNISIDYGVMEKARNVHIIPASFGWSDLGTWNSAYDNMEKDYLGNAVQGENVMVIDGTRNIIHVPHNKLVVLQGVDDLVIVDTDDVMLICKRDREQDIKDYMAEARRYKGDKFM